jgi:hypothetical protein
MNGECVVKNLPLAGRKNETFTYNFCFDLGDIACVVDGISETAWKWRSGSETAAWSTENFLYSRDPSGIAEQKN